MIIIWSSAAFSTYLCGFQLKYIQGDIYVNVIVAQISEILAYIISGSYSISSQSKPSYGFCFCHWSHAAC